jgi:hypothetical protein
MAARAVQLELEGAAARATETRPREGARQRRDGARWRRYGVEMAAAVRACPKLRLRAGEKEARSVGVRAPGVRRCR